MLFKQSNGQLNQCLTFKKEQVKENNLFSKKINKKEDKKKRIALAIAMNNNNRNDKRFFL